jgi:hypothetical protein
MTTHQQYYPREAEEDLVQACASHLRDLRRAHRKGPPPDIKVRTGWPTDIDRLENKLDLALQKINEARGQQRAIRRDLVVPILVVWAAFDVALIALAAVHCMAIHMTPG